MNKNNKVELKEHKGLDIIGGIFELGASVCPLSALASFFISRMLNKYEEKNMQLLADEINKNWDISQELWTEIESSKLKTDENIKNFYFEVKNMIEKALDEKDENIIKRIATIFIDGIKSETIFEDGYKFRELIDCLWLNPTHQYFMVKREKPLTEEEIKNIMYDKSIKIVNEYYQKENTNE